MSRRTLAIVALIYLVGGIGLGLLAGWGWQMQADGCDLSELNGAARRELLLAVALARPTQREEVRCAFPGRSDGAIADLVEEEAESVAGSGTDQDTTTALVSLASLFGRQRPDLVVYAATLGSDRSETPEAPSPTPTLEATTVTPEEVLPFAVTRLQAACDDTIAGNQVQVRVSEGGEGRWGRRVRLEWEGGASEALTGVKSPAAAGYADFSMEPGVDYRLYVVSEGGQVQSRAVNVSVAGAACSSGERALWFVDFARRTESVP